MTNTSPSSRRHAGTLSGLVVALALLLVVSACSSDDGSTTEATSSPLADFLGQGDFATDPDAAQARFVEEERARQEIIAQCMQAQGFEYTPQDPSQFISFGSDEDLEWGSEEWTAKWGFGISTQRFDVRQVGPDLLGNDFSRFEEEAFEDPNEEYLMSLSESELDAYYEALQGDQGFIEFDESLTEEEMEAQFEDFEWEPSGCEGEAYQEDESMAFFIEFEDELQEMETRFQADPRIQERQQEISSCVADKGHDYVDMDGVYQQFEDELAEIERSIDYSAFELSEEEMASMSEAELEAYYSNPPELSDEAKAQLGELQTREIEMAKAVLECGGGFAAEFENLSDIRAEYEQEFLDTYAEELEPFRVG